MNELLQVSWTWHPSVVIGFSLWTIIYALLVGILRRKYMWGDAPSVTMQILFHCGTLAGLFALVSPLDALGDEFLFSAHMVQHLLLMLVTAPLWILGTPVWLMDLIVPPFLKKYAGWIASPLVSFAVFVGVMAVWHIPALYNLTMQNESLHIFEHLTFIGGALIGWRPVVAPNSSLNPPAQMLYLFLLGIPSTAIAALLTFTAAPLYPFYSGASRLFGLSVLDDQHLGGLLMWIPMHMILFLAFCIVFFKWFDQENSSAGTVYQKSLS